MKEKEPMLSRLFENATVAHAHCDLYCGVYDPAQAKIEAMSCLKSAQKYHDSDDDRISGFLDLREEIFQNMIGDEVTIAINSLPIDFRTVVLLCDVEGFTYEEISKIIDVPIGTVRSRLFRARNMLKEKLSEYARRMGYKDKRGKS